MNLKVANSECPFALPFPVDICQALFENAPGLFLVLNPDFRIVAVSDEYLRATMNKREDILNCGIFEVFPDNPADPEATGVRNLTASLNRVLKDKVTDTMALQKYDIPSPGGGFEERYWSAINAPVFYANHETALIIHRVEDVTAYVHLQQEKLHQERLTDELARRAVVMEAEIYNRTQEVAEANLKLKQAIQDLSLANGQLNQKTSELKTAVEELEAFSSSVAHDLKNPLLVIEGFSLMLAKQAGCLDAESRRLLEVIRTNTRHMRQLINDLLMLSKTGRHRVKKSTLNLAEMTKQVFAELRRQEGRRDLQLMVEDLPLALGDPGLLMQVLVNLLSNAIKFTGTRETALIVVGGKAGDQENIYFVQDNGVGFEEKYSHKLFEVFQRLHSWEEFEGTGLGLTIVKRIVQRHGGRVWAEGKVGQGATFYFSLPQ